MRTWWNRYTRLLSGRTSKTNSFELQLPVGNSLMGHLTPTGDLYLQFSDSSIHRIPGHLIRPLAHWLGGVDGRYSWIRPSSATPRAVVLPFLRKQKKAEASTYEEWLTED